MPVVLAFAINTIFNFAVGLLVARFLGPAEYGRFALASAVAIFINTALFDWLRLAATRFYSERTRQERPEVRATMELVFGVTTLALGAIVLALVFSGVTLQLTGSLLALAAAVGVSNGLFDFHSALARARFANRTYATMVGVKHALAMLCVAGGAWWFNDARIALIGICLSIGVALGAARRTLSDAEAHPSLARYALARLYFAYAAPIVVASVLYQAAPLLNRSLVTAHWGFAETGQFALAYDIGVKLVMAIGSTVDVVLFQMAVRAEETHGREHARRMIGRNMAIIFAVAATSSVGLWMTLPSFEALLVPAEYRGPFAVYLTAMLPGIFAFAMMQFAINPVFQLAQRTNPVIVGSAVALLANVAGAFLIGQDAGPEGLAWVQSGAVCLGLLTLVVLAARENPVWPRWRDALGVVAAIAAMALALAPMRSAMSPGALTLLAQVVVGVVVCTPFLIGFDVGQFRAEITRRLRGARAA